MAKNNEWIIIIIQTRVFDEWLLVFFRLTISSGFLRDEERDQEHANIPKIHRSECFIFLLFIYFFLYVFLFGRNMCIHVLDREKKKKKIRVTFMVAH